MILIDEEKQFVSEADTDYKNPLHAIVRSVFQHFEKYLRTEKVSEENIEVLLIVINSRFVSFEISPEVYEMTDNNSISNYDVTMKTRLNTNNRS